MGRRCFLSKADGPMFPNMYVVMTGPPAVRKSSSIKYMKKVVQENTGVTFAPHDTGGQRQGLIKAMRGGDDEQNKDADDTLKKQLREIIKDTQTELKGLDAEAMLAKAADDIELDTRDPYSMYIAVSELNSILGENNTQMLTFLQQMWDGEDYTYALRGSTYTLKNALLNIIGCTTPTQISLAFPPEAIGQGFMSRIVFVFEDRISKIYKSTLDMSMYELCAGTFSKIHNELAGEFKIDPGADKFLEEIYMEGITLRDPRFSGYCDRRMTAHVFKVAMCLAASRGELVIRHADALLAHQLLMRTEDRMPDALGEYGMNKLSAAKQRLIEYIRAANGPVPYQNLYHNMHRDMTPMQYRDTMRELVGAGKVALKEIPELGGMCVIATSERGARARQDMAMLTDLLERRK